MQNPTFAALLEQMLALHDKKNADYAKDDNPYSNFEYAGKLAAEFSDPTDRAFVTLIGVKLARLAQLLGASKLAQNESADDSLIDLATYTALWASWRRDKAAYRAAHDYKVRASAEKILRERRAVAMDYGLIENDPA